MSHPHKVWLVLWHGSLGTRVFRQKPSQKDLTHHFGTIQFDKLTVHESQGKTWYDLNEITVFSITEERVY